MSKKFKYSDVYMYVDNMISNTHFEQFIWQSKARYCACYDLAHTASLYKQKNNNGFTCKATDY